MGLTLGQFLAEVRRHHANRDDWSDADITRALNLQQERLARVKDWEELYVTDVATPVWTGVLATDKFLPISLFDDYALKEVWSLRVIDDMRSEKLEYVQPRQLDEIIPYAEAYAGGLPSHYTNWSGKFELWRIPDRAYQYVLRGVKWPAELSTSEQQSDFDHKDEILIAATVAYIYHALGEYEDAGRFFRVFEELKGDALEEQELKPDLLIAPPSELRLGKRHPEYWRDPFVLGDR